MMPRTIVPYLAVATWLGACAALASPDASTEGAHSDAGSIECGGARPAVTACSGGLYDLDCGGTGSPRVACAEASGRCYWLATGCVPEGFVASDCPPTSLCCHASAVGHWAFADDWRPTPMVALTAQTAEDLVMLDGAVVSLSAPATITVAVDPTIGAPNSSSVTCAAGIALELCNATRVTTGTVRGSLVVFVNPDRVWRQHTSIEVIPTTTGAIARAFVVVEQDAEMTDPDHPRCEAAATPRPAPHITGTVTINSLSLAAEIHGHAELSVDGAAATLVF